MTVDLPTQVRLVPHSSHAPEGYGTLQLCALFLVLLPVAFLAVVAAVSHLLAPRAEAQVTTELPLGLTAPARLLVCLSRLLLQVGVTRQRLRSPWGAARGCGAA